MPNIPPQKIDYNHSPRQRYAVRAIYFVTGAFAGVLTYAAVFFSGVCGAILVGAVAGLLVGYFNARAASTQPFFAGFLGNVIALASLCCCSVIKAQIAGAFSIRQMDWIGLAGGSAFYGTVFIVPGLLGSLWVWEGRKPPT